MKSLLKSSIGSIDWSDGVLSGPELQESARTIGQLGRIFHDQKAWSEMNPEQVVYRVQWLKPVEEGTPGGLFWGNTMLEPGRVGEEYFMTHGHSHANTDRSEFYATVQGTGFIVFMNPERKSWVEPMLPGSIHYVHAHMAHRVVNTGSEPLRFVACWPSDAGHDYASIAERGFSLRVLCREGRPEIVHVG
jgi:glucose-6-phosphate isomerase